MQLRRYDGGDSGGGGGGGGYGDGGFEVVRLGFKKMQSFLLLAQSCLGCRPIDRPIEIES